MKQLENYDKKSVKKRLKEITKDYLDDLVKVGNELASVIQKDKQDPKYLGIPNINFSLTEPDDDREKKFAKQRIERGFDTSETWSLRDTIADFILPRLRLFREIEAGYPGNFENREDWNAVLDKMIRSFEIVQEDNKKGVYDKEVWKEYDKGMRLFTKYFLALWW